MDDKNTSTSSTQSQTQTETPNTPGYLSSAYQQLVGQLTNASANPSDYYPEASSTLQNSAFKDALNLPSIGTSALNTATNDALNLTNTTAPTYTPTNANSSQIDTGDIQRLLSPYLNDVVNSSTALYDKQAGQDQATLAANAGLNFGAFGSSGYALDQSNLTGTQALDRSNIQSSLLNQGYDTSLTGAEQDSAQQQATNLANAAAANQAAQANQSAQLQTTAQQLAAALGGGQLASTSGQLALADNQQLGSLGATQYGQDVAQQQFYPNFEAQLLQILNGTPVSALSGYTSTGTGTSSGNSNTFGIGTDLLPKISIGG